MKTVSKSKMEFVCLFLPALLLFFGMYAYFGIGIYSDTDQYVRMHIHREPLYPLFLWVLRSIYEDGYLQVAAVIQTIFAAWSVAVVTRYVRQQFLLKNVSTAIVFALTLIPHIMTPLFSVEHVVLSSSIMSEAICLPLFLLFFQACLKMMFERKIKNTISCLILAVLLSLTRGQMMVAILIWAVLLILIYIREKRYQRILLAILFTCLVFGARTFMIKSYNYVFSGHFINNTYGSLNTLANVIYASDREDGEHITNKEEQEFFYLFYDKADEMKANYRYAGDSLSEKVGYLESWHDTIKFEVLETNFKLEYDKRGITDYYEQNLRADQISAEMIKELLPYSFGQWAQGYLLLSTNGLIRSIAVVNPWINLFAAFAYLSAIGLTVFAFRRNKKSMAGWTMIVALLSIVAIVYATSLTIMCLSRYMIYGFSGFYIAYYLLLSELKKEKRN